MGEKKLYEEDYYLWIIENIKALQTKKIDKLDVDNIIEEMQGMSKNIEKELRSRLKVLMHQILKYNYQKSYICPSWMGIIVENRLEIKDILEESPSLKKKVMTFCERKYTDAVALTAHETRMPIDAFPKSLELSEYEILEKDYYMID